MTEKTDYTKILDDIQNIVHEDLKKKGFRKKGRTHNLEIDKGIIQVINFQMDKYPVSPNYDIPGFKESLWGKFTINLGVYVDELFAAFHNQELKSFAQDYDCEIRTRLSNLVIGRDEWYLLDSKYLDTAEKIINGLSNEGQIWFSRFNSRYKIVADLRNKKQVEFVPREKLAAAVIQLGKDRQDGENIFTEYFHAIDDTIPYKKGHKIFVSDLADRLKIKIN